MAFVRKYKKGGRQEIPDTLSPRDAKPVPVERPALSIHSGAIPGMEAPPAALPIRQSTGAGLSEQNQLGRAFGQRLAAARRFSIYGNGDGSTDAATNLPATTTSNSTPATSTGKPKPVYSNNQGQNTRIRMVPETYQNNTPASSRIRLVPESTTRSYQKPVTSTTTKPANTPAVQPVAVSHATPSRGIGDWLTQPVAIPGPTTGQAVEAVKKQLFSSPYDAFGNRKANSQQQQSAEPTLAQRESAREQLRQHRQGIQPGPQTGSLQKWWASKQPWLNQRREKHFAHGGSVPSMAGGGTYDEPSYQDGSLQQQRDYNRMRWGQAPAIRGFKESFLNNNPGVIDKSGINWLSGGRQGDQSVPVSPALSSRIDNQPLLPAGKAATAETAAGKVGNGAAGSGMKRGFGDYANAAMGIYGLVSALTAKKPTLAAPARYQSQINPATGLPYAQMQQAQQDIAANTRQYSRPTTSSHGTNVLMKLGANANANQAYANLGVANSQAYKQDTNRVSDQLNHDYATNYQLQRGYQEGQYNQNLASYAARMQGAGAAINNSLQYENARSADLRNKGVEERMSNNRLQFMHQGDQEDLRTRLTLQGMEPDAIEAELAKRQNPYARYATNNYQKRARGGRVYPMYARGGRMTVDITESSQERRENTRQQAESNRQLRQLSLEYSKLVQSASQQAINAFHRSIASAHRTYATPFKSH